jgi:hypothetical protein
MEDRVTRLEANLAKLSTRIEEVAHEQTMKALDRIFSDQRIASIFDRTLWTLIAIIELVVLAKGFKWI